MFEALITTSLGIIASFLMYKKGKIDGKKEKHEDYITTQIDKLVDLYNEWARSAKSNGLHALANLGLEILENDQNIRKAIKKIEITSGKNPFGSQIDFISGVDLFLLFKFIRVNNINTIKVRLQDIVNQLKGTDS